MRAERLGLLAEIRAVRFLKKSGMTVVRTRFRARGGEIDLIAREGNTLAFVEVKAGMNGENAAQRVDPVKRARLRRAAEEYLRAFPASGARFDVLEEGAQGFTLIRNAF